MLSSIYSGKQQQFEQRMNESFQEKQLTTENTVNQIGENSAKKPVFKLKIATEQQH